jgi:sensor histidine kinase YesM
MTIYSGVKIEPLELSVGSPYAAASSTRRDFVNNPEQVQNGQYISLSTGFISGFPNEVISRQWFGSIFSTFFDLYYNTIHIIPEKLEIGAISSDIISDVLIWNANLVSDSLLSISGFGQGVSYLGSVLPIAMSPLSTRTISFGVQGSGVVLVDLNLVFKFQYQRYTS